MGFRFVWRWLYIASFFLLAAAFAPFIGWGAVVLAIGIVVIGAVLRLGFSPKPGFPLIDRLKKLFGASPVVSPPPHKASTDTPTRPVQPRIDLSTFNQDWFERALQESLIEQNLFSRRLGRRLLAHFVKVNPNRALSVLVGGPPASGKSGLPDRIGEALTGSFENSRGDWPVVRFRCTHDQDIDWAAVGEVAAQTPGCVIALDNVEQPLKAGGEHGRFAAGLEALLTQPAFARCIVLLITNAGEGSFLNFEGEIFQKEERLEKEALALFKSDLGDGVLKNIEFVTALETLSPEGQFKVIGSLLAETVREFGIELHDLQQPVHQDEVEEFFIAGLGRWSEIGEGGAYMIRRWLASACRDSLAQAQRAGWKSVQIREWDPDKQQLTFEPG